jgi:integrase
VDHVKAPKSGRIDYYDMREPGLELRVAASGRKSWCYYYRMPGSRRKRRLTIDKVLSLAKARGEVLHLREQVKRKQVDPGIEHAEWKAVQTFGDLCTWHLKKTAKRKSSAEETRILTNELLPRWRDRKIHEITRAEIKAVLNTIAERPAPVMANRGLALISRMYNLALAWEEEVPGVQANPAARIVKPGGEEIPRDRVLSPTEIRTLCSACEQAQHPPRVEDVDPKHPPVPISPLMALGMQLILVTAQRPGECFGMRRADLDEEKTWWTMPRTLTKNQNSHRIPITATAKVIIEAAIEAGPEDHAFVFAGDAGASISMRAKKAAAQLATWKPLGFVFHRHDLRRTAATETGAANISGETISKVLNHADRGNRSTRVYDKYSYDAEKQVALEAWERRRLGILAEKDSAQILPMRKRA